MSNIDIFLIGLFLLGTLIAGFRHISRSFTDFAVGDRNFSNFSQIATIVATWMSGANFFFLFSEVYNKGFSHFIILTAASTFLILTGFVIVPRVANFVNSHSLPEAMSQVYGREIRIFVALGGIFLSIVRLASQLLAISIGFQCFNIPGIYTVLIIGGIVCFYSTTGGVRSVTYTDIVQFIAFSITMVLIFIFLSEIIYQESITLSSNVKFDLSKVVSFKDPKFIAIIPIFLVFLLPGAPMEFQRILLGSNNLNNVKNNFVYSGIILLILFAIISISSYLLYSINPDVSTENLMFFMTSKIAFPGIIAILMILVMSMVMSTADSFINLSSILIANDLFNIKAEKMKLIVAKISSFCVGIFAIILALVKTNLLSMILLGNSFYHIVISPIVILTIFGFRTNKKYVLIAMLVGFLFTLFKIVMNSFDISAESILLGMIINVAVLMILHYMSPKQEGTGWIGNKDNEHLKQVKKERKENLARMMLAIKKFSFIGFCMRSLPRNVSTYTKFGLYLFLINVGFLFSQVQSFLLYQDLFITLFLITLSASLFFFLYTSVS